MTDRTLRYKGMRVNMFGLPVYGEARQNNKFPKIPKRKYLCSFAPCGENVPKNLLIIYDIPEERKKERDWFRRQLRNFSFVMIQRSVWVGPSPLPNEFLAYIRRINLKKEFKTFKLARGYKI